STLKRRGMAALRIEYWSFLVVAAATMGCNDTTPTSVRTSRPAGATQSIDAVSARAAVRDAIERIVPQLSNARASTGLADALRDVDAELGSSGSLDGRTAMRARTELDRYAQSRLEDAAELDAIRLSLAAVAGMK